MKADPRVLAAVLGVGAVLSCVQALLPQSQPAFSLIEPSANPQDSAAADASSRATPYYSGRASGEEASGQVHHPSHRKNRATHAKKHHKRRTYASGHHRHHKARRKHRHHADASPSPMVDLNHASIAQLESLPGIDLVLAQRIIRLRTAGGSFDDPDDLLDVEGITPAKLTRITPQVSL